MGKTIALLTDFGAADIYVGVMKAVMQRICRDARFIDITHTIQPQNVREAAFALLNSYRYFAEGAIFLVVVDPGVGSARRPIAVQSGEYFFVAPDNGVLTYALSELGGHIHAVELANDAYRLPDASMTFHGRDVFAPAAAHLAASVPIGEFGPECEHIKTLPEPELSIRDNRITAEVLHVDHFGNIVTSIGHLRWETPENLILTPRFGAVKTPIAVSVPNASITVHGESVATISRAYHQGADGCLLMLVGSNGHLEIALNQGNAAEQLGVSVGDRVTLDIAPSSTGQSG